MIQLSNLAVQTVLPGQPVTFNVVRLKSGCGECYNESLSPSSIKMAKQGTYEIGFSANIGNGINTDPVQLSIAIGGTVIPDTTMISTPATVGALNHVSVTKPVRNCCCDFDRITVVNSGTNAMTVGANPILYVKRISG